MTVGCDEPRCPRNRKHRVKVEALAARVVSSATLCQRRRNRRLRSIRPKRRTGGWSDERAGEQVNCSTRGGMVDLVTPLPVIRLRQLPPLSAPLKTHNRAARGEKIVGREKKGAGRRGSGDPPKPTLSKLSSRRN